MIPAHVRLVFLKDGREVLRDRRTLFVNLVLPVLLYPVLMLFLVQVAQLTQAKAREPGNRPAVALLDVPAGLAANLARRGDGAASATAAALRLAPLRSATAALLAAAVTGSGTQARLAGLAGLRAEGLAAAVVWQEPRGGATRPGLAILYDDAHHRNDDARAAIEGAIKDWRSELVKERLAAAGVPATVLTPFEQRPVSLAPPAEAVRTRLAGIVPLLLVLFSLSGAFLPAIDLLAGERERGTLETLLSWPARRRDIFVGKLLVCCVAAVASVALQLLSLTLSAGLLAGQLPADSLDLGALAGTGLGVLGLCFVCLVPICIGMAALVLAITGLAESVKEAQNHLGPLLLVVMAAAMPAALPHTGPSFLLDLVPITGTVLALKASLESSQPAWGHLALATAASGCLAVVLVSWATRLLESERFRYPGLVRAGWGRWRRWGPAPGGPGALESLGVYALAVGAMALLAPALFKGQHPALVVVGPLLTCIALPALLHRWAGGYPEAGLSLGRPRARHLAAGTLLAPAILLGTLLLGLAQAPFLPQVEGQEMERQIRTLLDGLYQSGGLPLAVLAVGLMPGICEELLCRGTLLSGFRRSLGPAWAVLLSAFLFAALHGSPHRFFPQMWVGIALGLLTLRTGTIWPAVIVHALHNGMVVLAQLCYENHWAHPLVAAILKRQEAWAGALVATALVAGLLGLRLLRRRPDAVTA